MRSLPSSWRAGDEVKRAGSSVVAKAAELARARAHGPAAAPAVRVPELLIPVAPMPPPAATQTSMTAQGGVQDREILVGPFKWENFLGGSRRVVCATTRTWRGIDCYMIPPASAMLAGDAIHVRVYAIAQGVRALVTTGFYAASVISAGDEFDPRPVRVCAARALAERFEVEVMFVGTGLVADTLDAQIIAIAHNEAIDAPRGLGAWGPITALNSIPSTIGYGGIRLLGVRAGNTGAALQYALVVDKNGPVIAGEAAKWSFPVGPGQQIEVYPPEADSTFFARGFYVVGSTTPDVVTLGSTVTARAWIR